MFSITSVCNMPRYYPFTSVSLGLSDFILSGNRWLSKFAEAGEGPVSTTKCFYSETGHSTAMSRLGNLVWWRSVLRGVHFLSYLCATVIVNDKMDVRKAQNK